MPEYYHSPRTDALLDRMEALLREGPGDPMDPFPLWESGEPAPADHLIPEGFELYRTDVVSENERGGRVLLHVDGDPEMPFEQTKEVWDVPLRCQLLFDRVTPGAVPSEIAAELLALFTGDLVKIDDSESLATVRLSSDDVTVDFIREEHAEIMSIAEEWETEVHVTFTVRCRFPAS